MATQYAVDLKFGAKTRELDAAVNKLNGFDRTANKLKGKNPFEGAERGARGAGKEVDRLKTKASGAAGASQTLYGHAPAWHHPCKVNSAKLDSFEYPILGRA